MGKMHSDLFLDLAKYPNQKTGTFTFMRFLRSKIDSESSFPIHKVLHNYFSDFLLLSVLTYI